MPELSPLAQTWVNVVLIWIGFGSLAGLLARVILPFQEPTGSLPTLTLGITGSAIGSASCPGFKAAARRIPSVRLGSWPPWPGPLDCF